MRKTAIISARGSGRIAAVLGASLLVGALVAGCGSDSDSDSGAGSEPDSGSSSGSASATAPTTVEAVVVADAASADTGADPASAAGDNRKIIESAVGGGYAAVCTFSIDGGEGTMHIGGQERFHFEGTSEGAPARMLRSDDTMYIWAPGEADGVSIKASDSGAQAGPDPMELQDNEDYRDLTCERYTGDMGIFDVPADVTFMTLQDIVSKGFEGATD